MGAGGNGAWREPTAAAGAATGSAGSPRRFRYNAASASIMPSPRAFLRVPRAVFLALVRFVRTVVVVGFAAFALALLAVRFVVFPQIESYRDTLAGVLSRQLGQPVEIAALTTGWDGWNPKLVVEGFRVLDRARASADAAARCCPRSR